MSIVRRFQQTPDSEQKGRVALNANIRRLRGAEKPLYRKSTLPNGVRVITETMPAVRSATLGIWADVGSASERSEQRGISHLIEHMLFKGTKRRSAQAIAETMDGVGANLNAFTDKETTCYYAKVMDHHVPLAIDVLSDMFLNSVFDPREMAKEQNVVLEEIKMYDDSPDEQIHDLFIRTMWSGSDLGEPTIGYADTVSALKREDLRAHMRGHYAPNAVVVAAAGNLVHDRVVELFADAFASYTGYCEVPEPDHPHLTAATNFKQKDTEQAYVVLGTRGLSLRDERRYALSVLDTILGGGMSSRLFQEVREKRGLVYSVYSFQQSYREAGLFAVSAGTSPANVRECVEVITQQLQKAAERGVSEAELSLAKEHIKGNLTLSLESTSSRMIRLGRGEFTHGYYLSTEEIEGKIDAVTCEQVLSLAHELLAPANLGLCVLGPVDEGAIGWQRGEAVA
ncbi:MAG: insulinase family protein [Candidatus Eremiobacteraeota bacterium]|nr:insulinase family protein [Candidatus Eremiobacteraeota bacterium]